MRSFRCNRPHVRHVHSSARIMLGGKPVNATATLLLLRLRRLAALQVSVLFHAPFLALVLFEIVFFLFLVSKKSPKNLFSKRIIYLHFFRFGSRMTDVHPRCMENARYSFIHHEYHPYPADICSTMCNHKGSSFERIEKFVFYLSSSL